MKVLHVTSLLDPVAGGSVVAVTGLAAAQHAAGLDVTIVSTQHRGADTQLVDQMRALRMDVRTIAPARGPLWTHPDIDPVLETLIGGTDVVHMHRVWEQIQHRAARIAHNRGVPYLMSPHGMLDPWCLAQKRIKKRLYLAWRLQRNIDRATAVHCTTTVEQQLIRPLTRRTESFVETLGVDLDEFEQLPPAGSFRKTQPAIGDRPIVLFLSRVDPKKGLDLLVPAFAQSNLGRAVLVIAGPDDGGYKKTVQDLIAHHRVQDRVFFTGMLHGAERISALAEAELMVLPSYQENFGIVVIESLAAGTPVIISDQVNLHGDIAPARVGAVVPTRVDAVAETMQRWMNDHAARGAAAQRARPFAFEHYGWTTIGERWIDHYGRYVPRAPS